MKPHIVTDDACVARVRLSLVCTMSVLPVKTETLAIKLFRVHGTRNMKQWYDGADHWHLDASESTFGTEN
jgi:hypothetical protein